MRRVLPYPFLWLVLVVMWLVLNRSINPGQILLGAAISGFACWFGSALEPPRPTIRSARRILELLWLVLVDVIRSNFAVFFLIVGHHRPGHHSAFLTIPLRLKDRNGLAVLACIITATPGSAWIEYNSRASNVTVHVLDLVDEAAWIETIKEKYESRLLEIFR